jgi:hypothetical protein
VESEAPPWLRTLDAALATELAAQRAELERGLALPPDERIAQGVSWPLVRTEAPRRAGRWVVCTVRPAGGGELHDGIDAGALVSVRVPGVGEVPGRVREVAGAGAELAVGRERGPLPEWLDGGVVEISLRFDGSTLSRYRQRLSEVGDSPLARVLLGSQDSASVPASIAADPGLNDAQNAARALALGADPLTVVHGPPGTGKTRLLASVLQALRDRGERPWALADSNAAVDHLALTAASRGLRVLRVGSSWRMSPAVRHLSLDHALQSGPLATAISALERDLRRAWDDGLHREARQLQRQLRELRDQAQEHAITSAEVLALTFGSLAGWLERLPPARTAVVDEATQVVEPAIWVAVPHVENIVLVGDPEQLGPVVISRSPVLERSVLERLLHDGPPPTVELEVQHRMVPPIQALVREVYGPAYTAHPSVCSDELGDAVGWGPVLWVDTAGAGLEEERDPVSRSLHNPGELRLITQLFAALRAKGVPAEDVGVIAPYSAQVQRLQAALPAGVELRSVNGFQGREKRVILVSWVRCNPDGELGFVADPRRLTVALTRARVGLAMVGDTATLSTSPRFAALFEILAQAGQLESVWQPPWDAVFES